MLIDLHTHTRRGSSCSRLHTKDLVRKSKEMHLDAICVTDHNTTRAVEKVKKIGRENGLLVLSGVEVRTMEGDILVFGISKPPAARIPAQELLDLVHREEGASVVSHPFRASAPSLRDKIFKLKGFDALEVLNGNSSQIENQRASEAALRLKLPGTGGSDSHSKGMVGRYATEFEEPISNEAELVAALKAGRYKPKDLTGRQN